MVKYYAVANGRTNGIFMSWNEVEPLVKSFSGAKYKSFPTHSLAKKYIEEYNLDFFKSDPSQPTSLSQSIVTSAQSSNPTFIKNNVVNLKEEKDDDDVIYLNINPSDSDFSDYKDSVWVHQTASHEQNFRSEPDGFKIFYTDGSCVDTYGGFGIVEVDPINDKVVNTNYGPLPDFPTTNNRAELYAILMVLKSTDCDIIIKSDSMYSINSITKWSNGWMKNGWKTSNGTSVLNKDLILEILSYMDGGRKIKFEHVKAHSSIPNNELADDLANRGRINYK